MLARGRSHALNLLHSRASGIGRRTDRLGKDMAAGCCRRPASTFRGLRACINIDRMVLAELNAGRMRLPFGRRLSDALTDVTRVMSAALA